LDTGLIDIIQQQIAILASDSDNIGALAWFDVVYLSKTYDVSPIRCAHFCAHAHSKRVAIQPVSVAIQDFGLARKRLL
jgi:hypothetical protein